MNKSTAKKVDQLYRAKLQLGFKLLLCFVVVYVLFVALHVLAPDWLATPVAGVSLGLVLGVALICSTAVMAIIFHVFSCRIEHAFAAQLQHAVTKENPDGL
jgi:uncharacterized membrane protein (DUF485 family)